MPSANVVDEPAADLSEGTGSRFYESVGCYSLNGDEAAAVAGLLTQCVRDYASAEAPDFLAVVRVLSDRLPDGLRLAMERFRLQEYCGAFLVRGLPVTSDAIGPTPRRWGTRTTAAREEFLTVLVASRVGDVFGWQHQQAGTLVNDVLPMAEHVDNQIGTGSGQLITLHTEDAFHDHRGDYVGLLSLRNNDAVPTTVSAPADLSTLDPAVLEVLRKKRFRFVPDEAHSEGGTAAAEPGEPVAVVFGDPARPYLRFDPYFMAPLTDDPPAAHALDQLAGYLESARESVALLPGDMVLVDNFRAVHGRMPFRARFDGADRWLLRINVTRDLRRSVAVRRRADDRVIAG